MLLGPGHMLLGPHDAAPQPSSVTFYNPQSPPTPVYQLPPVLLDAPTQTGVTLMWHEDVVKLCQREPCWCC